MSVHGNYDDIAENYALDVENKPIHLYYSRPATLALLPKELKNKQVLDLGCGTGWYTEYLLNQGAQLTALDSSEYLLNYTKNRVQGRAHTVLADLEKPLSMFSDLQFDCIIAPLVIHYIDNWLLLFHELARILKNKGEVILSLHQPHMTAVLFQLKNYFEKSIIEDHWDKVGKVRYYHHTLEALFDCIHQAGFVVRALKEPQPLQEMQAIDPKMYENITTKPWFLFLKIQKES